MTAFDILALMCGIVLLVAMLFALGLMMYMSIQEVKKDSKKEEKKDDRHNKKS